MHFSLISSCPLQTIAVINSKNGSTIWQFNSDSEILHMYIGNFIPDQDNDKIPDILAAHTSGKGKKHKLRVDR